MKDLKNQIDERLQSLQAANVGYLPKDTVQPRVLVCAAPGAARRFIEALRERQVDAIALVGSGQIEMSWHSLANEVLLLPDNNQPQAAEILAAARLCKATAVFAPGYAKEVEHFNESGNGSGDDLLFIGPTSSVVETLGRVDEVNRLATQNSVPLFVDGGSAGEESSTEVPGQHIEVTVFNRTALYIQRSLIDGQVIIKETADLGQHETLLILAAAEQLVRLVDADKQGLISLEFCLDASGHRLRYVGANWNLAAPVIEQALNIDLVSSQLNYSMDNTDLPLGPILQDRFKPHNHVIELHIYALEPGDQPLQVSLPSGSGVRCDFAFSSGDSFAERKHKRLGRVVASGQDRRQALARIERAMSELFISGVRTNIFSLLQRVRSQAFVEGGFYDLRNQNDLAERPERLFETAAAFAALSEAMAIYSKLREAGESQSTELAQMLLQDRLLPLAVCFGVSLYGRRYEIRFAQADDGRFRVYSGARFLGFVTLLSSWFRQYDFSVRLDRHSCRVRVDKDPRSMAIGFADQDGKTQQFELQVEAVFEKEIAKDAAYLFEATSNRPERVRARGA